MTALPAAVPPLLKGLLSVERLSLGRAAAGAVMIARPTVLATSLGVDSAAATRTGWVTQMLGAREVALGLGTFASLRGGDRRATRLWLYAGVLSDAVDLLAVGRAVAAGTVSKPAGGAVVAIAGGAVYAQLEALGSD